MHHLTARLDPVSRTIDRLIKNTPNGFGKGRMRIAQAEGCICQMNERSVCYEEHFQDCCQGYGHGRHRCLLRRHLHCKGRRALLQLMDSEDRKRKWREVKNWRTCLRTWLRLLPRTVSVFTAPICMKQRWSRIWSANWLLPWADIRHHSKVEWCRFLYTKTPR